MNVETEKSLLERFVKGDEQAFDLIYDLWAPRLFRFLLLRLRDISAAEDILQSTMLETFRQAGRLAKMEAPASYIFRVGRNRALDFLAKRQRESQERQTLALAQCLNNNNEADLEQARVLDGVLQSLPEELKEAVYLHIHSDLSFREMGETLNCTAAVARYRYEKAIELMKKEVLG